ncbi:MAG: GNAT family N-acetyltransferase [Blautia sp.]|nr:GNAT family N-acetyltransferase [Blautia sp.]
MDADLDQRVGKEIQRSKYEKYNQLDKINKAIVVYENDVLVGAGSIRYYDEKDVELKRIYVSPAFRGQGIGTKLVSLLIEWAKELGYQRVVLETGEKLAESVALYKKLGFERIPNYGPYENMPESLCMAKNI